MESNRRDFIKKTILGAGIFSTGLVSCSSGRNEDQIGRSPGDKNTQLFNMSGYAAAGLENVRIGIIGLGMRGRGAVRRMSHIEGVEIVALCDKVPERVDRSMKTLKENGLPPAKRITGSEDAWKAVCEDSRIDLVYICTCLLYTSDAADE